MVKINKIKSNTNNLGRKFNKSFRITPDKLL